MNSDYDFTLNSSESPSSGAARNRFLDSLGVGENALRSLEGTQEEPATVDEGLVLSSQPEVESSEASVDLSKGRAISISVNRGAAMNRSLEITVPSSPKAEEAAEAEANPPVTPVTDDLDTIINLSCPECAGDLVIKRRHLGVEGACVWCHTPIVAAETARDRQVRVFALLGGIQKPEATVAPAVQEPQEPTAAPSPAPLLPSPASLEQKAESASTPAGQEPPEPTALSSAPWKPFDATVEHGFSAVPEVETLNEVTPDPQVSQDPADNFYGGNFGFSPSFEPAALEDQSPVEEITHQGAPTTAQPLPMDLDDLYASSGFGSPAEGNKGEPGFGETMAQTPKGAAAFNPAGFGAFLQSPAPVAEREIAAPLSPWSGTGAPDTVSDEPLAPASPVKDEESPAKAGFASPTPWGPPTTFVADESVIDSPPTLIKEEASPSDWASAFENHREPESSVSPQKDTAPEALPAAPAFAGFESGFGSSSPEAEKPVSTDASTEAPSGFFFSNAPASTMLFGRSESTGESFAMPGHCFSTGSSSAPEPKPFEALFPSLSEEEVQPPIFEAAEMESPAEFPSTHEAVGTDSLFPSINQGPSLFGDSPFVSFQDELANETAPAPASGSAFSDLSPAPFSPAAGPENPPVTAIPESANHASPAIASLPPINQAKPKPKVRKGFIVLMVIIVGFASGAALASFVLPVDEYVQTARAFMEKKFNPAGIPSETLPLPLPTGTAAATEITEP